MGVIRRSGPLMSITQLLLLVLIIVSCLIALSEAATATASSKSHSSHSSSKSSSSKAHTASTTKSHSKKRTSIYTPPVREQTPARVSAASARHMRHHTAAVAFADHAVRLEAGHGDAVAASASNLNFIDLEANHDSAGMQRSIPVLGSHAAFAAATYGELTALESEEIHGKLAIKLDTATGLPTDDAFEADRAPDIQKELLDDDTLEWIDDRPHDTSFFMPEGCPTGELECCLTYNGEVCGGVSRGICTNITASDDVCDITNGRVGLWWFTDFYEYACVCNDNYWGAACEECKSGWEGDDCNTRTELRVRRNFASLSDVDKQYVIDGFRLAKITPHPYRANISLYDYWAVLHRWSLPGGVDQVFTSTNHPELMNHYVVYGHIGTGAIPYHRSLVYGIERALQLALQNDSFALPYWNWTGSAGNDNDVTLKWFGGDGDTTDYDQESYTPSCRDRASIGDVVFADCHCPMTRGPFAMWPIVSDWGYPLADVVISRAFGCDTIYAPSLPVQAASDCCVANTQFENTVTSDGTLDNPDEDFRIITGDLHDLPTLKKTMDFVTQTTATADVDTEEQTGTGAVWDSDLDIESSMLSTSSAGASESSHSVFHNLLGGGSPCATARTWPNAVKFSDMHERAHRWLSGTLLFHHPASDPLFWMLHSYADLIFEQWVRNTEFHGRLSKSNSWAWVGENFGHGRDECQGPFFPLRSHWTVFNDTRVSGVDWDYFEVHGPKQSAWEISEPTMQSHYFDGTEDYTIIDRSDDANPTDHVIASSESLLASSSGDYGGSSSSSFSGSDTLGAALDLPEVSGDHPENAKFFWPTECSDTEDDTCCPTYNDETCGGEVRGSCLDVDATGDVWWVSLYFSKACVCNEGYWGAACESCAPGYSGDDCSEAADTRVRRNFSSLATDDMQYIVDTFRSAKTYPSAFQPSVSIMDFYGALYFSASFPSLTVNPEIDSSLVETVDTGGGFDVYKTYVSTVAYGSGALTYYRALLYAFERELAVMTANESFALPYWDWSHSLSNDNDITLRFMGGDGSTGSWLPYSDCRVPSYDGRGGCYCKLERVFMWWSVPTLWATTTTNVTMQRAFGCLGRIAPSLPTYDMIEYALALDEWWNDDIGLDSFSRLMTGQAHDATEDRMRTWPTSEGGDMLPRVLNWIGGTATTMELADFRGFISNPAADPLFWLSINYADLVTERWIRLQSELDTESLPDGGAVLGNNVNDRLFGMVPLQTNAQWFTESTNLGYTYDYDFDSDSS